MAVYQIIGRYFSFLNLSISWTEEALRFIFVAIIMFGIASVVNEGSLTKIDAIVRLVSAKSRIGGVLMIWFRYFMQIICFAMITYFSFHLAVDNSYRIATLTHVSYGLVYAPMPIGMFISMIISFLKLIQSIKIFMEGGDVI